MTSFAEQFPHFAKPFKALAEGDADKVSNALMELTSGIKRQGFNRAQDAIRKAGGIPLIIAAMERHEGVAWVQQCACLLLSFLPIKNKANQNAIRDARGIEVIADVMRRHEGTAKLQEVAGVALSNLGFKNKANIDAIRENTGVQLQGGLQGAAGGDGKKEKMKSPADQKRETRERKKAKAKAQKAEKIAESAASGGKGKRKREPEPEMAELAAPSAAATSGAKKKKKATCRGCGSVMCGGGGDAEKKWTDWAKRQGWNDSERKQKKKQWEDYCAAHEDGAEHCFTWSL